MEQTAQGMNESYERFDAGEVSVDEILSRFEELILAEMKLLHRHDQSVEELMQQQKKIDSLIDQLHTRQPLWAGFIANHLKHSSSLLDFIITFRFVTLKRINDMLTELGVWDLDKQLSREERIELLVKLRSHVPKVIQKVISKSESAKIVYETWTILKDYERSSFSEQMQEYIAELRFSVTDRVFGDSNFEKWGIDDYRILGYECQAVDKIDRKKLLFSKLANWFRNEFISLGISSFPEKVSQWFKKYADQIQATAAGDTDAGGASAEPLDLEWVKAIQARVQASYLLEGQISDLSMKRLKWIASQDSSNFEDDEQSAEVKHRYLIVSKLNELYQWMENPSGTLKPDDVFKPKQDDVLRKGIQDHIREQVRSRNIELTKHRRIVALAFYNHGKYEVKNLLHFVKDHKKNNREYIQFIIWLYGDKPLSTELDSLAQRELKSEIEWYIEVEIIPEADENVLKLFKECDDPKLRKFGEPE